MKYDSTAAYCKTDKRFFFTTVLAEGAKVEVWSDVNDEGFVAIRPPAKETSFLPASAIRRTGKNTGIVEVDSVRVWVGGDSMTPPSNWQPKSKDGTKNWIPNAVTLVTLKKGDAVEIKGEISVPYDDGVVTQWKADFLKIEPPSGEFRWIQESRISRTGTEPHQRAKSSADSKLVYGGKTFNQWVVIARNDREPETVVAALEACAVLASENQKPVFLELLSSLARQHGCFLKSGLASEKNRKFTNGFLKAIEQLEVKEIWAFVQKELDSGNEKSIAFCEAIIGQNFITDPPKQVTLFEQISCDLTPLLSRLRDKQINWDDGDYRILPGNDASSGCQLQDRRSGLRN